MVKLTKYWAFNYDCYTFYPKETNLESDHSIFNCMCLDISWNDDLIPTYIFSSHWRLNFVMKQKQNIALT